MPPDIAGSRLAGKSGIRLIQNDSGEFQDLQSGAGQFRRMTHHIVRNILLTFTLCSGLLSTAPASQAQTGEVPVGYTRISAELAHNAKAPAEKVYRDLKRIAHTACGDRSSRTLEMLRAGKRCVAEMVESGVAKLDRADIADLHKSKIAVAVR
jgi:UrcA family protein